MDTELLKLCLVWIITGGGAGAVSYWLIEHIKALAALAPELKRYVSYALSGGLGILAYLAMVQMLYVVAPSGWREWVEALFAAAAAAIGVAQVLHARFKLSKKSCCC